MACAQEQIWQEVKVIDWKAESPEGFDCSSKAWQEPSIKALSNGPFKAKMIFRLDKAKLAKGKSPVKLLSVAEATVEVDQHGSLTIMRTPEFRVAGKKESASSIRSLEIESADESYELCLEWTGQTLEASIDGEVWVKLPSVGTRVWSPMTAGAFPGRIYNIQLFAR